MPILPWRGIVDVVSGVVNFAATVLPKSDSGVYRGDHPSFVDMGLARSGTVDAPWLVHNAEYVSAVRARDRVGIESVCASNGFRTDFTPPDGSATVVNSTLAILADGKYQYQLEDALLDLVRL